MSCFCLKCVYIYIYIYILLYIFTFILSVHDFAWFTLICYIKILKFCIKTSKITSNKYYRHQSEFPRKINSAKHLGQGIMFFCSCCGILWRYSNTFHQTYIISVSRLSLMLCFPTNSFFALLVAKIGMSVLMQTSVANRFFGDDNLTGSSSRRSSKSFQQINSLLHLQSSKIITSSLFAPTQAYLSFAGLLNAL